jgi:hypothetical protein
MSSADTEAALKGKPPGSFLVRFSSTVGQLAVSLATETKVVHTRLAYQKQVYGVLFSVAEQTFLSYEAIMKAHPTAFMYPLDRTEI